MVNVTLRQPEDRDGQPVYLCDVCAADMDTLKADEVPYAPSCRVCAHCGVASGQEPEGQYYRLEVLNMNGCPLDVRESTTLRPLRSLQVHALKQAGPGAVGVIYRMPEGVEMYPRKQYSNGQVLQCTQQEVEAVKSRQVAPDYVPAIYERFSP